MTGELRQQKKAGVAATGAVFALRASQPVLLTALGKKPLERRTTPHMGWVILLDRAGIAGKYPDCKLSPRFVTSIAGTSAVPAATLAVGANPGQRGSQGLPLDLGLPLVQDHQDPQGHLEVETV